MVASLDGAIAVAGRSRGLSSPLDAALVRALRASADMILVGAGTVRDERYGPPSTTGQRIGVITNSGRIDVTTSLFTSGAGFVICPESAPSLAVDTLRCGSERVDLPAAIARLDEMAPGSHIVQAEGGPILNGALAEHDLIDELNLTISPRLVAGSADRLTSGADERLHDFDLVQLVTGADGFVFTRWLRRR